MPENEGFNAIWVMVDHLMKIRHLEPCPDKEDGRNLGEIFFKKLFRLHEIPKTIISDCGPQFGSEFWKYICKRLGMKRKLTTASHPQTDSQIRTVNSVIKHIFSPSSIINSTIGENGYCYRKLLLTITPQKQSTAQHASVTMTFILK